MIDLKITSIGGPECAAKLAQADSGIRDVLRAELAEALEEIRAKAEQSAPRRTGIMASKIIAFLGRRGNYRVKGIKGKKAMQVRDTPWKDGRIEGSVMPTGRVAHLVERGVSATFFQRPGRGRDNSVRGKHMIGPYGGEATQGPDFRYQRTLRIAARPFFWPAVESVGGAEAVNARPQGAPDDLAVNLNRGGA